MSPEHSNNDLEPQHRGRLDPLIAPLVRLLNAHGYATFSSCEGHADGVAGRHPHISIDPAAGQRLKALLAWLAESNSRTRLLWQLVPFFAYEEVGVCDTPDYCLLTPADTNDERNLQLAHEDFAVLTEVFLSRFGEAAASEAHQGGRK